MRIVPNETYVKDLVELGFPEASCRIALKLAGNDKERAVELYPLELNIVDKNRWRRPI